MKTAGIICEYNPFHLGHARQLRLTREILGADTVIVCVMSGNYVQRGAPAMWDKFTRAKAAVSCNPQKASPGVALKSCPKSGLTHFPSVRNARTQSV